MPISTTNKFILTSLTLAVSVVGLIYLNFQKSQNDIKNTKPAPLSINLVSYPESISINSSGSFFWTIDSSPDLSTSFTTIYWGYESSPSALTVIDSPDAVRYPYSQPDYAQGTFRLPDLFDVNIKFNESGQIWFRAYARVGNNHLWSEEKTIEVK